MGNASNTLACMLLCQCAVVLAGMCGVHELDRSVEPPAPARVQGHTEPLQQARRESSARCLTKWTKEE